MEERGLEVEIVSPGWRRRTIPLGKDLMEMLGPVPNSLRRLT